MTPLDLLPYAEHSRKLSNKQLVPVSPKKSQETWKILTAHFFDFSAAFLFSSFMAMMFNLSVKNLLVTHGLRTAFSEATAFNLSMALLPLTLFTYFFTSYFMNHGQTWGMLLLKRRIEMKAYSFRDSFSWATHSFLLCATGGLSYAYKKSVWENFKHHDHLYTELVMYRDQVVINLISEVDKFESEVQETDWSQAA